LVDGIAADIDYRSFDKTVIGEVERLELDRNALAGLHKTYILVLDKGLDRCTAIAIG
jgi:hypothetical protein